MAKRDYDKDLRALRKELRKRIKQHKKRTDLQQEIEKTKLLKKRALAKEAKAKVKKKSKPVKKVSTKKKKYVTPLSPVRKKKKKKYVAPLPLPRKKKKAAKKKVAKKRKWFEPKPRPEPKVKVYVREVGDARGFSEEHIKDAPEEVFSNSSRGTRARPNNENVQKIFENTFTAHIKHGPFEKDEVNIFRHGVIFRPAHGEYNENLTNKIAEIVSEVPGSSIHVVPEEKTFSVRLNFGSPSIASNYDETSESFQELAPIIRRVYDLMYDYGYEDIDWFDFWDTEESMYDSK